MGKHCKYCDSQDVVDYGYGSFCRGCNRKTTIVTKDTPNAKNVNPLPKRVPCPHCSKKFLKQLDQKNHLAMVHKIGYTCSICGFVLVSEKSLKNHMEWKHNL